MPTPEQPPEQQPDQLEDQVEFDVLANTKRPSYAGKSGRGFQMNPLFRLALEIAMKKDLKMTLDILTARRSMFLEQYHAAGKSTERVPLQAEINVTNIAMDQVRNAMQTKSGIIITTITWIRRLISGPEPSFVDQRTLLIQELRKRKPNS